MENNKENYLTEEEFLKAYKPGDYERPSVTVDMLLFTINEQLQTKRKESIKDLEILLIKRKNHPYMNCWALPGGFVGIDESLENAAYRELKEETNLSEDIYLEQLYTFGEPKRDPRMRVISVSYMALTHMENINRTKAGDDACDALWFKIKKEKKDDGTYSLSLKNLEHNIIISYNVKLDGTIELDKDCSNNVLAFDHEFIINLAIDRLRGKIFYSDIAFNLLPKEFTLNSLKNVYEVILGETLDKGNFRKRIISIVEEIDEEEKDVAHRPAKLYKKRSL